MSDSKITYKPVPDIPSCYDVFLDGREVGRVWQVAPNRWFSRHADGTQAMRANATRHQAAMWCGNPTYRRLPADAPESFASRIARRRRERQEASA